MEKTSLGGVDHHYSQSLISLSMIERIVNRILFKITNILPAVRLLSDLKNFVLCALLQNRHNEGKI